jgi:hypothetical protein
MNRVYQKTASVKFTVGIIPVVPRVNAVVDGLSTLVVVPPTVVSVVPELDV